MEVFKSSDKIPDNFRHSVIGIGKFDGIHIGHQQVIKTCKLLAQQEQKKSVILTFTPHPDEVLSKRTNHKSLTPLEKKLELIKLLGIDAVIIQEFTEDLSLMKATDFIKDLLMEKYQVSQVVTGYNFFFGHKKSGDPVLLSEYANKLGFCYTQINKVMYESQNISSSRIKELLSQGRIKIAGKLLGRNYEIEGTVVEGEKIAKKFLGTPTANIVINEQLYLPLYGVYIVSLNIKGSDYYGIANIGNKPTVNMDEASKPNLEVYIFDFDEDIYGEHIRINLLAFLRPERKFQDLPALKHQIKMDISASKYCLSTKL